MAIPNWAMIQDGGTFESLVHSILYAEDPETILFGRPGKDAGQDARSADGFVVYQAKYRKDMLMDVALNLAIEELEKIKKYRETSHQNCKHWQNVRSWVLVTNLLVNPNDKVKWEDKIVPEFMKNGLMAEYWGIEQLNVKLDDNAHIRDSFFGGENRVLIGLKEAHDLLNDSCIGSGALDKPMVGREREMQGIKEFIDSPDKRILPVIGPGGIGKSRLLYECMVLLAEEGWRVLWALPQTMARSSRWFYLLNSSRRTCVALDDPDDPGLLGVVIEQLTTAERRNWKVILSCRSEKAAMLQRYKTHPKIADSLKLKPLNEVQAKELLKDNLQGEMEESFLHQVCKYTGRVPGWLCLVAELVKRGKLSVPPLQLDDFATVYVNSCLGAMKTDDVEQLLRWLSLWGFLRLDVDVEGQTELSFLNGLGMPQAKVRQYLGDLVKTGLVHNWGIDKRMYAVEPLIIRECILSSWLLEEENGAFQVSMAGKILIDKLVNGQVPAVDRGLSSLSHLTRSRLDSSEGFSFFKPIFVLLVTMARAGTIMDQYRLFRLVEQAGSADPESAMDVLKTIRENKKEDSKIEDSLWGAQAFTHSALLSELSWTLFQLAELVQDDAVAQRYLNEFRELITWAGEKQPKHISRGKSPHELLERLLCESRNWRVYLSPAHEIVKEKLSLLDSWPFVSLILKSLLSPERRSLEWVSNHSMSFVTQVLAPSSHEWQKAIEVRKIFIKALKTCTDLELRFQMWQVLAESHQQYHRFVLQGGLIETDVSAYQGILIDDLTRCAYIMQSPPVPLTIEEAAHARKLWSWYLKYGQEDDPLVMARQCEGIYNSLSHWRLHDFFRPDADEALVPETERIAGILRTATETDTFVEFFNETNRYLEVVRQGHDWADFERISYLAYALVDLFTPFTDGPTNPLTSYVLMVLGQAENNNEPAWRFAVYICQIYLRRVKEAEDVTAVGAKLTEILAKTQAKERFLYALYSNPHPDSTGRVTKLELECIIHHEAEFSDLEWFSLLGAFALVNWGMVRSRLRSRLAEIKAKPKEASEAMRRFILAMDISVWRFEWPSEQIPTAEIIDMIAEFGLDGNLFNLDQFMDLRERSGFKFTMSRLMRCIRSRMELGYNLASGESFQVLPGDFSVADWCRFDETDAEEEKAFHDFCLLALEPGFVAIYWMPKYIAQLNPSGHCVGTFVEEYLKKNRSIGVDDLTRLAYLASAYSDASEEWAIIARPICQQAQVLRREERESVYSGLSRQESEVITSVVGEVSEYYRRMSAAAARMFRAERKDSPLREYREWALRCAEADLKRAQERAEEHANG
ncbi:MAG: ATP-binding protein [Deltaproteobacteria bacterium]|nr:ATP-binding protein [Deltaproteobacteria bacterium]